MDFTFGIITGGGQESFIDDIITSIENENIPNYEIIIVGNCNINRLNTNIINFDETIKSKWITRKKNIITENAKYENVVFMHDYIKLEVGWYNGQLIAGNNFNIRMDKIVNYDGSRFRDWCCWCHNPDEDFNKLIERDCLIPYDMTHLSKYMYISGSYWIAKKYIMQEFPLDENLGWGESEYVIWSMQVREKCIFDMNVNSTVKIMKPYKDRVFDEPNEITIKKLKDYNNDYK